MSLLRSMQHCGDSCTLIISIPGKNAKLPGYMDYLHLSTADVAILKGSWAVLEEHVTRVGVDFFLDLMNNHEEIKLGTVCPPSPASVQFQFPLL